MYRHRRFTPRFTPSGVLVVTAALAVSCTKDSPRQQTAPSTGSAAGDTASAGWFRDVAAAAGIDFTHASGAAGAYQLPEIMGSGCAWIDHDLDGDLDAYLLSAGHDPRTARNRLYRNDGKGSFTDVTAASGTGDVGFGMGCAVGDYDLDGDPDLYVTNFGPNTLYRNNGDATFSDVTAAAGVGDPRWGASAAFSDIDGDGDLDLFVTNYMKHPGHSNRPCADAAGRTEYCGPLSHFPADRDTLYRNEGDGRFVDITFESGIGDGLGYGLGVVCADFNADGHVDFYVANDVSANQLWIGDGTGHFVDRAVEWGAAFNQHGQPEAGMGVQTEDIDRDGHLDILVTNLVNETNTFYRGLGGGTFEDETHAAALAGPSLPMTGFGMGFLDADLDGDLDLLVSNGRVRRGPRVEGVTVAPPWDLYAERDQYFEHREIEGPGESASGAPPVSGPPPEEPVSAWRFEERSRQAGLAGQPPHLGRGLALGDYDNDGDMDALVVACGGRARLYRNEVPRRGHWITVHAVRANGAARDAGGVARSGAAAYGARVTVEAAGRGWTRRVQPAASYLSSGDPRLHFGLGDADTASVTVHWPDGSKTALPAGPVDRIIVVEQGRGAIGEIASVVPLAAVSVARSRPLGTPEQGSFAAPAAAVSTDAVPVLPDPRSFEPPLREVLHKAIVVVGENSHNGEAWGKLGMICHAHGLHAHARDAYRRAGTLVPEDSLWFHLLAVVCERLSLTDEAVVKYEKSIEMEPFDVASRCSLARILVTRGEYNRARLLYIEARKINRDCVAAAVGLGELAARAGVLDIAERAFKEALEKFPRCGPAHASLARLYERQGKPEMARAYRSRSLACGRLIPLFDPAIEEVQRLGVSYTARMKLGDIQRRQRNWRGALEHYRGAVAIREDLVESRYLLGVCLARAGDLDAGMAELLRVTALEAEDRRVDAWLEIARAHTGRGQLEEARQAVAAALEADPRSAAAHVARGNLHRREKESAAAAADYDLAVKLEPEYAPAHLARGLLLQLRSASREEVSKDEQARKTEQSRARAALAAFDRAMTLDGDLAEAFEGMGRVHMQLREFSPVEKEKREHVSKAIMYFARTTKFFPDRKSAHVSLIRAFYAAQLRDEMLAAVRAAHDRWPADPQFRRSQ